MMTLFLLLMILNLMIFWLVFDSMHAAQTRRIQKAIAARDYLTAAACLQGKKASFLFGSFGCRLGQFDLMTAQDKVLEAERLLAQMEAMPLRNHEKATLFAKAFNFYLIHDNQEKCFEYTEKIRFTHSTKTGDLRHAVTMAYDAIFAHSTDHLEDILNIYHWKSFTGKAFLEYELACIYDSIDDEENHQKYESLYASHEEELRLNPAINGVWMNH